MKYLILIVVLTFNCYLATCQTEVVAVDSVSQHIGETVQVCSKVYGIQSLDKVTFINVGAEYPKSPLTIAIFAKDLGNFKGSIESLYATREICVTGVLKKHKGKTEIVISKPDEIYINE